MQDGSDSTSESGRYERVRDWRRTVAYLGIALLIAFPVSLRSCGAVREHQANSIAAKAYGKMFALREVLVRFKTEFDYDPSDVDEVLREMSLTDSERELIQETVGNPSWRFCRGGRCVTVVNLRSLSSSKEVAILLPYGYAIYREGLAISVASEEDWEECAGD